MRVLLRLALLPRTVLALALIALCASAYGVKVQEGHPRIYFNDGNKARFILLARQNPHWGTVVRGARGPYHLKNPEGAYNARAGAMVALVTSDSKMARKVIDYLKTYKQRMNMRDLSVGRMNRAAAHAYDWVYNFMSTEERDTCAKQLIAACKLGKDIYFRDRWSSVNNHGCQQVTANVVAALATWEHGGKEELWPWAYKEFTGKYLLSQEIMGPYGGWFEGNSAYIEGFLVNCYHAMDALRSAAGIDHYAKMPDVIRGSGYFASHVVTPDGIISPWADSNITKLSWKCWWAMAKGARESRDPELQWFAKKWERSGSSNSGWTVTSILMYDPSLPARPPTRNGFTSGQRPDGVSMGYVFMRTGNGSDDVHVGFRCGDYFGHHNHADSNAFTIHWKGVEVAVDPGYQTSLKSKDSKYHNTLDIQGANGKGGKGSQRFYHVGEPMTPQEVLRGKRKFEMGDLVAFEETDQYIYACGDASGAYSPRPRFFRHILLVKRDRALIVADSVDRPNTWKMQTKCKAAASGRLVTLSGRVTVRMRVVKGGDPRVEGRWVKFDSPGGENIVVFSFNGSAPPVPDCQFNRNGPGGRFGSWTLGTKVDNPFPGGSRTLGAPQWAKASSPRKAKAAGSGKLILPPRPKAKPVQAGPTWIEANKGLLTGVMEYMRARRFADAASGLDKLKGKLKGDGAEPGRRAMADAARAGQRIRQAIIDAVAGSKRVTIYVDIAGRRTRARLVSAKDGELEASAMGQRFPIQWSSLSDAALFRLGKKHAEASARLDLLRFAAYAGLTEQSSELAGELLANPATRNDARKILHR